MIGYTFYISNKLDQMFLRDLELERCKTDEQKERLKDRWVIEDSAERIADAIHSVSRNKPRLFGLF